MHPRFKQGVITRRARGVLLPGLPAAGCERSAGMPAARVVAGGSPSPGTDMPVTSGGPVRASASPITPAAPRHAQSAQVTGGGTDVVCSRGLYPSLLPPPGGRRRGHPEADLMSDQATM